MKTIICIFLGGGTGSVLRYLAQFIINKNFITSFPVGTLSVNLLGSILIGMFYALSERFNLSQEIRLFLTIGLCGGFTTFSTFSIENLNLFKEQLYTVFFLNIMLSICLCILGTALGIWIAKSI